jgi:hypothetical protein
MKLIAHIAFIFGLFIMPSVIYSQNKTEKSTAVNSVFWGSRLVDQQTTETVGKNKFLIEILHRFGTFENGIEDLYGIYAPSNISMGIGYGISDRLDVMFQTEKINKIQELGVKYKILQQNLSNTAPISLSYCANLSVDAHDSIYFGKNYQFNDRILYANQLIASRQFSYKIITMVAVSYVHANSVSESMQHDKMELNMAVGYKLNKKKSLFINYQIPYNVTFFNNNKTATKSPSQGLNFGLESASPSHTFQLFMTTRDNISLAKDLANTINKISLTGLRLGFNIRIVLEAKKKNILD